LTRLRIIGIDPGIARTGFGVIDFISGQLTLLEYGCIQTPASLPAPVRLQQIYNKLQEILNRHKPSQFAIEELFFNKNSRTALAVGEGRGVAILTAASANLPVCEYTPLQIKQAVTGYGRSTKQQVRYMVKAILKLKELPNPDDIADALAVAICHAYMATKNQLINHTGTTLMNL